MLLQETSAAEVDSTSSSTIGAVARRFISAVYNTKWLAKPPYIVVAGDRQPQESFV